MVIVVDGRAPRKRERLAGASRAQRTRARLARAGVRQQTVLGEKYISLNNSSSRARRASCLTPKAPKDAKRAGVIVRSRNISPNEVFVAVLV